MPDQVYLYQKSFIGLEYSSTLVNMELSLHIVNHSFTLDVRSPHIVDSRKEPYNRYVILQRPIVL